MERLTSRKYGEISCTGRIIPYSPYCSGCITSDCDCGIVEDMVKKLAEYEDLEEQGRLVKLPCNVGDTVYGISMGKVITLTVVEFSIFCMKGMRIINAKCQNNDEFRNYVEWEFGKTVFLTKSEAEARLEELRGGGADGN